MLSQISFTVKSHLSILEEKKIIQVVLIKSD